MEILIVITIVIIASVILLHYLTVWAKKKRNIEDKRLFDEGKTLYKNKKNIYLQSLSMLKLNPSDPNIKAQTLKLGREFANLTREFEGVTIYDEMALMNDINAACAGVTNVPRTDTQTVEERLRKLSELKEKSLINEQEYSERRQTILEEI